MSERFTMTIWVLRCLFCGKVNSNLVAIQEHVMNVHGYTLDDLRRNTQRDVERSIVFVMPNGRDWLLAQRCLE